MYGLSFSEIARLVKNQLTFSGERIGTEQYVNDRQAVDGVVGTLTDPILNLPLQRHLDFHTGVGEVTFTRASTGTYIDQDDGLIKTAAIDEPRFEDNGLLIEGASENLHPASVDFSNIHWATACTLSAYASEAPDGSTTATTLTDAVLTLGFGVQDVISCTAGEQYTASIFAKAGTQSRILISLDNAAFTTTQRVVFDLSTGAFSNSAGNEDSYNIEEVNGWYRVSMTATADVTGSGSFGYYMQDATDYGTTGYGYTGDGTGTMHIWGAQCEALPFASSYIPTQGATVTRSADSAILDISNMPPIGAAVTHHIEWSQIGDNSFASRPFQINGATNYFLQVAGNLSVVQAYYGPTTNDAVELSWSENQVYSSTLIYNGSTVEVALDGVASGTPVNADLPTGTPSGISLGSGGTTIIWGNLRGYKIYNKALSADEVRLL